MSGRKKGAKAKIQISKPELPPFLQRMKEQIVANEDSDRRERNEGKRKQRPSGAIDTDDDPTIVKLNEDDLTEEEYKRMKKELETQYKLDNDSASAKREELDIDKLIQTRVQAKDLKLNSDSRSGDKDPDSEAVVKTTSTHDKGSRTQSSSKSGTSKKLSYGSSSEED